MKSTILAVAVFGLTAAFTGCKKDVTKDIAKFADQACACKDAACGDAVLEAFITFAGKNKDATGDQGEAVQSAQRMGKCMISSGVSAAKLVTAMKSLGK
ncbi:MAG: hypothetical protein KBG15_03740 [Kofleriaceae bacterium]|nr:hypothetical protein [Kofleriaceae bacterium]